MASATDAGRTSKRRAQVLDQLRERLDAAEELAHSVRRGLARSDAETIHQATSRMETLALEYKLLVREYRSLPPGAEGLDDPVLAGARAELEATATRVARSSAVACGLLERMVTVSRGLLALLGGDGGGAYLPTGRTKTFAPRGLQLRERA